MKQQYFNGKLLLRRLAAKRLPETVITRPKQGFSAPVSRWLMQPLADMGRDITLSSDFSAIVNKKYVEILWHEHLYKRRDHGLKLFGLVCLGLWLENARALSR